MRVRHSASMLARCARPYRPQTWRASSAHRSALQAASAECAERAAPRRREPCRRPWQSAGRRFAPQPAAARASDQQPRRRCRCATRSATRYCPCSRGGAMPSVVDTAASPAARRADVALLTSHAAAQWGWRSWEFAVALLLSRLYPGAPLPFRHAALFGSRLCFWLPFLRQVCCGGCVRSGGRCVARGDGRRGGSPP